MFSASTTYGKTIGMSAKLSAADRKALTAQVYRDRHDAFMKMLARQHELQQAKAADMSTVMYSHNPGPYLSKSKSATVSDTKSVQLQLVAMLQDIDSSYNIL